MVKVKKVRNHNKWGDKNPKHNHRPESHQPPWQSVTAANERGIETVSATAIDAVTERETGTVTEREGFEARSPDLVLQTTTTTLALLAMCALQILRRGNDLAMAQRKTTGKGVILANAVLNTRSDDESSSCISQLKLEETSEGGKRDSARGCSLLPCFFRTEAVERYKEVSVSVGTHG
ncbi:hypothetical protein DY000_02017644 [Brassica cretica]|uniref:Uncharacterized protein n=1 Tax=Brassica cretica TaxID=69181 RepID=A0ABQ7D681_BRACR|nr:hypothetical protein DY000_02017644 [Brassica cretica]